MFLLSSGVREEENIDSDEIVFGDGQELALLIAMSSLLVCRLCPGRFFWRLPCCSAFGSWGHTGEWAEKRTERRCFLGQAGLILDIHVPHFLCLPFLERSLLRCFCSIERREGIFVWNSNSGSSIRQFWKMAGLALNRQSCIRVHLQLAFRPVIFKESVRQPQGTTTNRVINQHLRQNSLTLDLHIRPQRQLLNSHARPRRLHITPVRLVDIVHGREMLHVREKHVDFEDGVEA
jgi:hypothetical protein